MIKYLVKKKVQKEAEEKGKKAIIYAGAIMTGVGVYFSYKAIQNHRQKKYIDDLNYLSFEEYDAEKHEEKEDDELEKIVKEFNSNRISCENCTDVPQEEMIKYANTIKDSKEDIDIKEEDYKEEPYEEYEYIEDDLNKEN
ncbi:hypothetical protein [Romboutsia sp.]|uniref:hypothetical protein n=1 Tax=Romboutsia sp. TaxID=1965302 RepID=UPI003F3623E5